MSADAYLRLILQREAVDTGVFSPLRGVQAVIEPVIRDWANRYLGAITPSGSFAKGTANKSGTDIDLFISLLPTTKENLKEIDDALHTALTQAGYRPKLQNVSLGIKINSYNVDLVPGKQQSILTQDHSLWRRKASTWTKTNVATHIAHVRRYGHFDETRILKLWRDQKGLDFPSFYLELSAIRALTGRTGTLPSNVWTVFQYLRDTFPDARIEDPANTNNIISDDLTAVEKARVKAVAVQALAARDWNEIVR